MQRSILLVVLLFVSLSIVAARPNNNNNHPRPTPSSSASAVHTSCSNPFAVPPQFVASCAATPSCSTWTQLCSSGLIQSEIYLGQTTCDTTAWISDRLYFDYLQFVVTPLFPNGLTSIAAYGQFELAPGLIADEPSKKLILIYNDDQPSHTSICTIVNTYNTFFNQSGSLIVNSCPQINFSP